MKAPYLLHFDVPCAPVAGQLPENSGYRLATATNVQHYGFDTADFGVQHLNLRPFYVDLFELNTRTPFAFGLELKATQHFLFFMLQGQARFTTPEGFYLSHAPEGHMAACYKSAGHYQVCLPPGQHVACCVTPEPEWLNHATEKLPAFRQHLETTSPLSHAFFPHVRIDTFLHRRLKEVLALKRNGHGKLDGFLRFKFAEMLEYYGPKATEKQHSLVYRVKEYLDASFQTHSLTSREVAKYFNIEERTLRNRFKTEFNLTIRDYYTALRLRYSIYLMHSEKLPVKDVYYRAGYNDESTFRYELRKYGLSRPSKM